MVVGVNIVPLLLQPLFTVKMSAVLRWVGGVSSALSFE